jgi:hypothetical protein
MNRLIVGLDLKTANPIQGVYRFEKTILWGNIKVGFKGRIVN